MRIATTVVFFLFVSISSALAQGQSDPRSLSYYFSDVEMHVDTMVYSWKKNSQIIQNRRQLPFAYDEENEVAEFYLRFSQIGDSNNLRLAPSKDYELIDSLLVYPGYARFKVRFRGLTESNFLKFTFEVSTDTSSYQLTELPLFPYTQTYVEIYPPADEVFIGEEVSFDITTNNAGNIVYDNRWTSGLPINYRIDKQGSQLVMSIVPRNLGYQQVSIPLLVRKPILTPEGFSYHLQPLEYTFQVKSGRLVFLQMDKQEITPPDDNTEPIEILIDNNRNLELGKTYRVENQEAQGGPLIAELYTKSRLTTNKILCLMRVYGNHRKSAGYLYIKDGDEAKFVTNVDITPKTDIQTFYVQREGKDWQAGNTVYPGETVSIKLEGQGLHKGNFFFQGADNLLLDSLIRNENMAVFRIKVPETTSSRKIEIFNHRENTGKFLTVTEYQRARKFDFMKLDFGNEQLQLDEINKPIYYEGTITDLVLAFDRSKIDRPGDLNGKQYLKIDVKVSNKQGNLLEIYKFDQVAVCPGENSPRFGNYSQTDCQSENINFNNYLSRKTYDLDEWSKIEIDISHVNEKYPGQQVSKKRIIIYLKRNHTFDVDVSFPGGLLILKAGSEDFANFGGISFAMIAQFSFYQEGRIAKVKPYKLGAGFIAINAFNFSEAAQANRDVGLVVMGSLYPISSTNKLTFPLYVGFGYLMKEGILFSLVGPGIRVQF
ncbi:MAG: hypothetical protein RIB86_17985 [Imperialibacter sp.]